MSGPLDGAPGALKYWSSFVSLHPSLWLLWAALTHRWVSPSKPWAFADPTAIMGPILDTVATFLRRIGCVIRGVGWHIKSFLLCLVTESAKPNCFTSLAVTPQGYKAGLVTPVQPTSSCMISLYSSASFPTAEKRKNRETVLWKTKR
jgi:hypothetical protein